LLLFYLVTLLLLRRRWAFYFNEFSLYTRAIATIVFMLITAPVATHMIGRAAYFDGIPLWKGTVQDDLHAITGSLPTAWKLELPPENTIETIVETDELMPYEKKINTGHDDDLL